MEKNTDKFIQTYSPAGEFLQSQEWRSFQESVGRKTFHLTSPHPSPCKGEGAFGFWANIIEHTLPIVGKYFYIPRGPVIKSELSSGAPELSSDFDKLIKLAKENNAGWIRIEPETDELLETIRKNTKYKIVKAPHDVQPKELLMIDIAKSEEELLAEMKAKTRYNIKIAQKRGVDVFTINLPTGQAGKIQDTRYKQDSNDKFQNSNQIQNLNDKNFKFYVDEFIRLTSVMAARQGITAHSEKYYRKMLENIPGDNLKLYVAEYEGKIIVANLVIFYGETCTYLHGASDDNFRNVMAPYLLQWRQICDAKKAGCVRYDFGGVKTCNMQHETCNKSSWEGITKFKTGFSPKTLPTVFPGSYDIIINQKKYWLYRSMQKIKNLL